MIIRSGPKLIIRRIDKKTLGRRAGERRNGTLRLIRDRMRGYQREWVLHACDIQKLIWLIITYYLTQLNLENANTRNRMLLSVLHGLSLRKFLLCLCPDGRPVIGGLINSAADLGLILLFLANGSSVPRARFPAGRSWIFQQSSIKSRDEWGRKSNEHRRSPSRPQWAPPLLACCAFLQRRIDLNRPQIGVFLNEKPDCQ